VQYVICLSTDFSMLISIVDDSLTDPLDKLKCMLFARDFQSLPVANVGDIVRFHRLKVGDSQCVGISLRS